MLKTKRLSGRSAALALGSWGGYVLGFILLYSLVGPVAVVLGIIPVVAMAWLFGTRGGLLASLLVYLLSTLLLTIIGGADWHVMIRSGLLGSVLLVWVGAVVGRLRDLGERMKRELAEHKRTGLKLGRSRREATQSQRLLLALSRAAQTMQRARAPEEVYQVVGEEMGKLGHHVIVFSVTEGREHLSLSYHSFNPSLVERAERITGVSAEGFHLSVVPGGIHDQAISEGRALFFARVGETMAEGLPKRVRPLVGRIAATLGFEQVIYGPMMVGGEACGLLIVAGAGLTEADVPAVAALASQTASALENIRLYAEIQEQAAVDTINAMPDGLILTDLANGRIVAANPGFEKLSGYRRSELVGKTGADLIREVIEPEDQGTALEAYKTTMEKGVPSPAAIRFLSRNGYHTPAIFSISLMKDSDGRFTTAVTTFKDVTELRRVEKERDRFFNFSMDMLCIAGFDGMFKQLNPAWGRTLGWTEAELLSKQWLDFVHPEDRQATVAAGEHLVSNEPVRSFENRYLCKDGSYRWMLWNSVPFPDEQLIFAVARDVTERKRAEERERRQWQQTLTVIDNFPGLLYVVDPETYRVLFVNKVFREALGNDPVGQLCYEAFQGFEAPCSFCSNPILLESREPYRWEYHNPMLDRDLLMTDQLIEWTDGRDVRFEIAVDITQRKQAEEQIRNLARFPGENRNPVLRVARDGTILYANEGAAPLLAEWDRQVGQKLPDTWRQVTADILDSVGVRTVEIACDGRIFSLDFAPVAQEGYVNLYGRDITERTQARKALQQSERELNIRNQIADIFLTVPDDEMYDEVLRVVLEAMESKYGVFGYIDERGDFVVPSMTRHIWDKCQVADKRFVFPRETWGDSTWPRAIREKKTICLNEPSTNVPEGHIAVHRHISLPIIDRGEVIGLFQVANRETDYDEKATELLETIADRVAPILSARLQRDRHEEARKWVEEQLLNSAAELKAANVDLESFAYSVSHDLRAPLRAIDGFSRILVEEYQPQLAPEAQRYLQRVRDNSQQMGRLIDDLLAFSRLGRRALDLRPVVPAELVRQALEELGSEQEGRRVEISIDDLPVCRADPAMLKQVWANLLSNALKFTRDRDPAVIEIGHREENGAQVYFVGDNGAGFDMQYADKLFGVFQRLHRAEEYEGTGVGLAIVQRIVHRHGGRIWAEAETDKGATIYFTLGEELQDG